ncbi:hypothetical protein [Brachybacterium sp. Z12]|uniref:hypothetical protein n=1 Tax=Brachybacterium sp. Z12 TaxID=2759167 RepID=UPI00223C4FA7|nr:hypothetical protein [Brachybacterium sp. Z12]
MSKKSKKKTALADQRPTGFPIPSDWKGDVTELDPRATPASTGRRPTARNCSPPATAHSTSCRSASTPPATTRRAEGAQCC